MKSMRVLVTERCNANCPNCFNKSIRTNSDMPKSNFIRLCNYLSNNGITCLKMMGGEPSVHPCFLKLVEYAQTKFDKVIIFTNAINERILGVNMREKDIVVYNLECLENTFDKNKLLLNQPGLRVIETQVSSTADILGMKKKIDYIFDSVNREKMIVSITLNCMEDIFKNKNEIVGRWHELIDYLNEKSIERIVDHNIPFCFLANSGIKYYEKSICSVKCSGLISCELKLRYCNQYSEDIKSLIDMQNDTFIDFTEVENLLRKSFVEKMRINRNKLCSKCVDWGVKCNGGCFMHKDFITRESIIKSL